MSTVYHAALRLHTAHMSVVPCWLDSKQPAVREWSSWQQERPSTAHLHRWFGHDDRALAVVCGAVSGNLEGIDIDHKPQLGYPDATALFNQVQALVEADAPGLWSRLVIDRSPNGGYHLAYRCDVIARNQKLAQRPATDTERAAANNPKLDRVTVIETRGEGGYLISAPSPGYQRMQGDLAEPPTITADERTILFNAARSLNVFVPASQIVGQVTSANGTKPGADYNARTTIDEVQGVLEAANWTVARRSGSECIYLRRPGKREGWSATLGHAGTNLLYVFSSNAPPFESDTAYTPFAVYTLLEHNGDFKVAARALGKGGYGDQRTGEALSRLYTVRATAGSSDVGTDELGHIVDANQTDAGNAECVALVYGNELRYCHTRNKWLHWDRTRWMIDTDGKAQRAALDVAKIRQAAALRIDDMERKRKAMSWGFTSESNAKRLAMLQTAAILEQFATTVDQYDRDPLLATVMNGTLDLRSGTSRPSHRDDYLTMQLGTIHDPDARCPRWLQFLDEVFGRDSELIAYIQRAVGYSLTGATSEQKLFLLHGAGANGKSVFLEVLSLLLGDYAANTSFDTFDAGRRNEATNDLAALKGKRLVTVIETDEDRRLAEARVKAVTGQDTITCRFLYGEFFSYRPQFKIWLAMNHKPIIRGTDRGIWRRIQLVPFTQNFEGRADTHLRDKLQAELPGILNWALTGLQAWLAHGVGTATAVERATDEYQRESDLVSQWLDECVGQDADAMLPAREGFTAFAAWCMAYGYPKPSDRTFQRRMSELNIERKQVGKERTRCYVGVRLLPSVLEGERYERYEPFLGESSLRNNASRKVYQNDCSSVHSMESKHDYSALGSHIQDERKSNGSVHLDEMSVRLDNGSVHPPGEQGRNGNRPTARTPATSITPVINQDKIRFVLDKLKVRGPTWAREFMDRVEGFDRWPQHVQGAVQAAEREALE